MRKDLRDAIELTKTLTFASKEADTIESLTEEDIENLYELIDNITDIIYNLKKNVSAENEYYNDIIKLSAYLINKH